jgi:hypothetical protein
MPICFRPSGPFWRCASTNPATLQFRDLLPDSGSKLFRASLIKLVCLVNYPSRATNTFAEQSDRMRKFDQCILVWDGDAPGRPG